MSYILDALKKADAERERGTVPGLHAQLAGAWPAPAAPPAPARRTLWLVVCAAAVASGSIAWRIWNNQTPQPVAVAVGTPAMPKLLPGVLPAPIPQEPAAAARAVELKSTAPPRSISLPVEPVVAPRKPAATAAVAVVVPKQVKARTAPAAASAVVDHKVSPLAEMPDEIRRELPPLTISGAIYSENIANRFLIINGQIFHETETPAPGVILLKIRLKSAVLTFKGYRYSVTY